MSMLQNQAKRNKTISSLYLAMSIYNNKESQVNSPVSDLSNTQEVLSVGRRLAIRKLI
jgi:outer membrane murein-binding lipoprotein Lpp